MAVPAAFIHRRLRLLPSSILTTKRPQTLLTNAPGQTASGENRHSDDEEIALITLSSPGDTSVSSPTSTSAGLGQPKSRRQSIFSRNWTGPKSILKRNSTGRDINRRHTLAGTGSEIQKKGGV